MRKQILTFALSFLVVALGAFIANAQGRAQYVGEGDYNTTFLWVTATAGKDHIRFASLGIGQRMRLEILNQAGDRVFDSDFRDGNLLDWQMDDSYGNRLPDDVYGCLITVEDMTGQSSHRRSVFRVADGVARFEATGTIKPEMAASSQEQDTMTILRDDEELPMIQLLHDGESGRIVSGKGALSFRIGNGLAGRDVEYMRLTADDNLGIGVSEPLAKLDVAGLIRAQGIMFSDGTIQKTAGSTGFVAIGGLEQRLDGDGTLVVRGKTGAGTTSTNSSSVAAGAKRQLLTAGKTIDPIYLLEGPTNTFFGQNAGAVTTGSYNSFFGSAAGYGTTTGYDNSFVGYQAGYLNTTGYENTFIGSLAGASNTGGSYNSFVGRKAGLSNTTGNWNSFFGYNAGGVNTTGWSNSFLGDGAGAANTTGIGNSFVGAWAGHSNTTANDNSFLGREAGLSNTTGESNSFFGSYAGRSNTTGWDNIFVGYSTGSLNTEGYNNSFLGNYAGYSNTTGTYNSFLGNYAGYYNTTGWDNSFVGLIAGAYNTTGWDNSFFGYNAGLSNTTESNNSFIGAYSDGAGGVTNATAVGSKAKVTQSNSLVLGSINGVNGADADTKVGIGTTTPDRKLQIASSPGMNAELHIGGAGDEAKDVFSGMGVDLSAGPAFNFGYSGFSFGRSSGFFNVRPDPSAIAPNPSLRFMTANQQRMIITNTGNVGIGTSAPKTTFQADGGDMYVGSPGQGMILRSPDGLVCVRLTVSNTAALVSTPMACP